MAITHYLLILLLVLGSSAIDGGLACSASLIILCLYVAHPVGGFLIVGDGVFSMEGLNFDLSVFNTPSSQLEELHLQCDLPHLSQNSQYLPKNLLFCAASPSLSVWGYCHSICGICEDLRRVTWTLDLLVHQFQMCCPQSASWLSCEVHSSFWSWWCFFHQASPMSNYFSVLVCMSWTILNFPHVVLTFTSTSRAPAGNLQNRYPSRSAVAFSGLLGCHSKIKVCKYKCDLWQSCWWFFMGVCYSHSLPKLYQDFLRLSIMYTCIKSPLPNNFLTFN